MRSQSPRLYRHSVVGEPGKQQPKLALEAVVQPIRLSPLRRRAGG